MNERTGEGRSNLGVLSLMVAMGLATAALHLAGIPAVACGFLAGMASTAGLVLLLVPSCQADTGDGASSTQAQHSFGGEDARPWIERIEVIYPRQRAEP